MQCLACNQEVSVISNQHLAQCCGLTLQEYALKYGQSLDVLVPAEWLNTTDHINQYSKCKPADSTAQLVLASLQIAGLVEHEHDFVMIPGEIRKLDQLLWLAENLQAYGFRFRQEYVFNQTTHRVVAINRLKARRENVPAVLTVDYSTILPEDLLLSLATLMAVRGYFYGTYVFFEVQTGMAEILASRLAEIFGLRFTMITSNHKGYCVLRAYTLEDATALLALIKPYLLKIPQAEERYYRPQPTALVAKELVFDSAHFITDHPDKCANLHGGRYNLLVKVRDRIDPITGFVVDYGYLKTVVKRQVIDKLDHKTLNLADVSLAWRSSTELINLFIWEQLINYLPNLYELQTYETTQSYCSFRGPSLEELQQRGGHIVPSHFQSANLGNSRLRRYLGELSEPQLIPIKTVAKR